MKNNYNNLVRFYNRNLKKLNALLLQGKNLYKQDILKRRIARLFNLISGMQASLKLKGATFVVAGAALFQANTATAQVTFGAPQTNPFGLTAAGSNWSVPSFVDLDNDGDKDILSGVVSGSFIYYQNTGSVSAPSYSAGVTNPFGLVTTGSSYSSPAFADLDNDGDMDMISGAMSGDLLYYKNTGTASAPTFSAPVTNPFGLTNIAAGYSNASFVDLDNDGDKDLLVGDYNGDFNYFQNTGTASAPAFAAVSVNPFGLATTTGGYSTVTFVDLDKDGDTDLFSGNGPGFDYFQNTGTASAPAFAAVVNNPFSLVNISATNGGATASFADLDNDADLDLISGISTGNFIYYMNNSPLGIKDNTVFNGLNIYPNPTNNDITIKFANSNENLTIEVSNTLGQVISTIKTNNEVNTIALPEAKGLYFVKIVNVANESNIYKIVKQ